MDDFLPPWPLLSAFSIASLALALTPGPGVMYIVTQSLTQGRRFGIASVAGVALGNLGNAFLASIGITALLAASPIVFMLVKYAGALYLIYLGVQTLVSSNTLVEAAPIPTTNMRAIFRDGFVVALLNPKTAVFFAAFLPQFISNQTQPLPQSIILGSLFVGIAAITDIAYALAARALAPLLDKRNIANTAGRYLRAIIFIGLGIFAAFIDAPVN